MPFVVPALLLAACHSGPDVPPDTFASDSPLAGATLYRSPDGSAVEALNQIPVGAPEGQERVTARIAAQPTAVWFTEPWRDPGEQISRMVSDANAVGQIPTFVVYGIPDRDCGLYSKGGASTNEQYLRWVEWIADGIDGRRAIVIIEPDAVAQAVEGCDVKGGAPNRYALVDEAIAALATGDTMVYLDAGNPTWKLDRDELADALLRSGVRHGMGIAVNVSNHASTASSAQYARDIASRVGVDRFVIDVSRNGVPVDPGDWCNSPRARLGQSPTTNTQEPGADAYLWIKQPGNSDGECGRGEPPAGQWWPEAAATLAS